MCKQLTPRHNPPDGTLSLGCTHLHPGIIPLAARSRLAARATDAKICLWQIKHRRVQTAAVGLCRGVYVFIGRVAAGSMIGNMSYNSRGDALTTVYGFLRGLLMYLQPEYNCISRETVSYTSRGTIPHIVTNYPRAYIQRRTEHFRGCLQTPVLNPPKADFSIRCACNQTRVCRRKCSDRRHPNESVPTEVF